MAYGNRKLPSAGKRASHATVTPRKNEHPERLIKRFLKKVKKERVIEQVRERRFYEKPSVKRRKKKEQRERVLRKLEQKRRANDQ
jgi:small subunit ribosomal protein S21